ncbi:TPA: hypothetical protein ACUNF5_002772 [Burkholderia orbicola]
MRKPTRSIRPRAPAAAASSNTSVTLLQVETALNRLRRRPIDFNAAADAFDLHKHQFAQLGELYRHMVSSRSYAVPLSQVPVSVRAVFRALSAPPVDGEAE